MLKVGGVPFPAARLCDIGCESDSDESNPDNEISKIYIDIAKKIKSMFIEN